MAAVVRYRNPETDRDIRRKWARDLLVQAAASRRNASAVLEVQCGEATVEVDAVKGWLFIGDDYDTTDGNAALVWAEFVARRQEAGNGKSPTAGDA